MKTHRRGRPRFPESVSGQVDTATPLIAALALAAVVHFVEHSIDLAGTTNQLQ
jgi:hypothetical protein